MFTMNSKEAVGAYLREIRQHEGLTGSEVIARIARTIPELNPVPNTGTLSKIELGKTKDSGIRLVSAINRVLGGNPAHIQMLASNDKASKKDGVELAQKWLALSPAERKEIIKLIENVGPGAVLAAAKALSDRQ